MITEFAPCATLRLFFPEILSDYKRILYVDTDIIFLSDPATVWAHFDEMSENRVTVGLVVENEDLW